MIKISAISACFIFAVICTAATSAQTLTGEMATLQYLVGTWDCSVDSMQPTGGMQHQNGTLTFAVAPTNTLSQAITSPMFSLSGFLGYSGQLSKYFSNTTDSMGGVSASTADRGTPGRTIFMGNVTMGAQTAPSRETDEKLSDTKIHHVGEVNVGGNWTKVVDATCTKR